VAPVTRVAIALGLAALAVFATVRLFDSAMASSTELWVDVEPVRARDATPAARAYPRLARRVILLVIDGLRLDRSYLPFLDRLRAHGIGATAIAPYPTWSRPGYISILSGVPPNASGVRTNRVPQSLRFDSIMHRARHAGLVVASAGDIGMIPPLYLEPAGTPLGGFDYPMRGDRMSPPAGFTWPFDDARRDANLGELVASTASVLATNADFILVLAGDVDRAGHPYGGASAQYRDAAATVDRELGRVLATVDLATTAIIVVADHGHSDAGGHGGVEPEVETVPLILAGAGIVAGRQPYAAHTIDVAPTIAALLGIAVPVHGQGRVLVELLKLDAAAAYERAFADAIRPIEPTADRAFDPVRLGLVVAGLGLAGALALGLRRRGLVVVPRAFAIGAIAWVTVIAGLALVTRGRFSPSAVPPLARLETIMGIAAPVALLAQLTAAVVVLRRREPATRLAAANGLAVAGLVLALLPIGLVRIAFSPPHLTVPDPFWLVGIPAAELAGGCGAAAIAGMLACELVGFAIRRRRSHA
jgi:Type I phosphodiesterase / nucleotide pyrophosphatase